MPNKEKEPEPIFASENLLKYLSGELVDGVPQSIIEIMEQPAEDTWYSGYCLQGPRGIQPYVEISAAVFITNKGEQEIGLFSHTSGNQEAIRPEAYWNKIAKLFIPERVLKKDHERFLGDEGERIQFVENTLFPYFQESKRPLALLLFCQVILETPQEVIYLLYHSDIRATEALEYLQTQANTRLKSL